MLSSTLFITAFWLSLANIGYTSPIQHLDRRAEKTVINANVTFDSNYTVQSGDTIVDLATKFNVGVCDLARLNGLMNPDFIYPSETLLIPSEPYLPDDYSCLNVNDTTTTDLCIYGGPHVYTTMPGDTIQKIANERYGITVDTILNYSPQTFYIDDTKPTPYEVLESGNTVKIPLCSDSRCIIETFGFWYGTGPDLARVYNTTVGQIMALNPGFNHSDNGVAENAPSLTLPLSCEDLSSTVTILRK